MQLIIIIFAIIGLVVGLAALYLLDLRGEADDKACRLSVLSRAGVSSVLPTAAQGFVPLKCTTKKICITTDKNSPCSQFAGETGVQMVVVPTNDAVKAAGIIEKTNVESMYDCWNLMGQGKLDIFPGTGPTDKTTGFIFSELTSTQPTCFICSRIGLSERLNDNSEYALAVKDAVDIDGYSEKNRPSGSQLTYLELFSDSKIKSYQSNFIKDRSVPDTSAIIFSQIVTKGSISDAAKGAAIKAGAGILAVNSLGGVVRKVVSWKFQLAAFLFYDALAVGQKIQNQGLSAEICGPLSGNKGEAREGCSILGRYDYKDINTINSECIYIEGNP